MKESTVTTFEVEESDYELLRRWVPEDPCKHCPNHIGCCGCPKSRERDEIIKPLKQAGVFEVHQKVQEVKELQQKLKEIEKMIETDKNFIAGRGFDLDKIFSNDTKKLKTIATFM